MARSSGWFHHVVRPFSLVVVSRRGQQLNPRSTRVGCSGWGGGESNGFKHISGLIPEDEEKQSLYILLIKEILLTHQFNREVGSLSHYSKGFCPSCHGNSDCDASLWNTSIWLYKSSYLYKLPHICTLEKHSTYVKMMFFACKHSTVHLWDPAVCTKMSQSSATVISHAFGIARPVEPLWTSKNSTHLSNKHVQSTKKTCDLSQKVYHKDVFCFRLLH